MIREIGHDGWLRIGWPEEWGGQNRSMMDQLDLHRRGSHRRRESIPYLTLNTVGPTIMRFGTESQKHDMLPKILKGELHFSIGYSEPESGTDLASLRTRARAEGDEWVINGQKMWTSLIQYADYIWLAGRPTATSRATRGFYYPGAWYSLGLPTHPCTRRAGPSVPNVNRHRRDLVSLEARS